MAYNHTMTDLARDSRAQPAPPRLSYRERFSRRFNPFYLAINRLTGGWLEVLRVSYTRYITIGGAGIAASLAYYALFSIFPLLLFLILVSGWLFESSEQAFYQAIYLIRSVSPIPVTLIENSLREAINLRSQVGAIGVVGLIWAATGFFGTLINGINRAWNGLKLRGLIVNRLMALGMIAVLLLLMILAFLTGIVGSVLPQWMIIRGNANAPFLTYWDLFLRVISTGFAFLMFTALYRWVPNKTVCWSAVLKGALVTTIAWEASRMAFTWYVSSGLVDYQQVFGSLGALVALLLWMYVANSIALIGANVVSTLDQREEQKVEKIAAVTKIENQEPATRQAP